MYAYIIIPFTFRELIRSVGRNTMPPIYDDNMMFAVTFFVDVHRPVHLLSAESIFRISVTKIRIYIR